MREINGMFELTLSQYWTEQNDCQRVSPPNSFAHLCPFPLQLLTIPPH